ncbi:MAG: M20/M25/M40 family metallo-hydrolase [Candidatus Dependentiae bacterium]|nr:M20/M25/M40 family metallo-hydrolase [Candidatus Dependentiae bacterium]
MHNKYSIICLILLAGSIYLIDLVARNAYSGGVTAPLNEQLISFLQDYIRIETTHPNPAYDKALSFLKKHALADGFAYHEVLLPSGNTVAIISFNGSDTELPALALNHHMDVVPATAEGWITPPFSGEIYAGSIIGRGTQDMKGIGATHYFALKELKEQGFIPKRSIHIFAVPDEEVGGFKGTKEFVKTDQFKQLHIGFVIDEGHASGIDTILDIKVAERKPIQVRITGKGDLAHGSHLACHNAVHDLVQFLDQIIAIHAAQQEQIGIKQPGELLSLNVTSLTAGIKKENGHIALNMVPDTAQATIDIRVPPTIKKREVKKLLDEKIKQYPDLQYVVLAEADEEPELKDYKNRLYHTLCTSIENFGLRAQPHYFEASSDLRFYQALDIDGIGFTPFTITDNIHGVNESVPVDQLIRGKDITTHFIKEFCG